MSIFRKRIVFQALSSSALVLALLVSGCSSDSGGGDPAPPASSSQSTISSLSVQGLLLGGTSGGASTAAASAKPLEDVLITVKLYNATTLLDTLYIQTDSNGAYRLPLSQTTVAPDRITLTFEKEGYVLGEKSMQIGSSSKLIQNMRLGPEVVMTQTRGELAFSASGSAKFRFGVVRQSDGSIAAIAGNDFSQARAAAVDTLLDIAIPVGRLDSGVEAVTARLAHFDPNDSSQVQSFPGDFVGSGALGDGEGINTSSATGASVANSDEYRLISSVFSQVRLQDQNGDALTLSDAATAAATDVPSMYLQVPSQSYNTITDDVDGTLAGIQVPIYIYRGGWEYAGNGTLVTYDTASSEADDNGYAAYTGTLPLPTNGSLTGLYVRIAITAGNEWIQWINLDWPIQAGVSVTEICFDANIVYPGDSVENYSGYMDISLPDGGYDWQYVDDGEFHFSVNTLGDPSTPSDWNFELWNGRIGQYETIDLQAFSSFTTGSTCNDLGTIELTNPLRYQLYGRMIKNGEAASGRVVYVHASGFLDWAVTDINGNYQMSIPSGLLEVEVGGEISRLVEVNGTVDNDEDSDNGNAVQLDITLPNLAPVITGFYAPTALTILATSSDVQRVLFASAYDVDSSGVTLSWECTPSTTCNMSTPASIASASTSSAQLFNATASGSYDVTVTADDGDGATTSRIATIEVTQSNRAPRAIAVDKTEGSAVSPLNCRRLASGLSCSDNLRTGEVVSYQVQAFDADGDAISYEWDVDSSCSTRSCTMPAATASGGVNVNLSDGNLGRDRLFISINVTQNQPPQITYMYAAPSAVMVDGGGDNSLEIQLNSQATDDVLVASYLWTLSDSSGSDVPIVGGASSAVIAQGTLAEGMYTATLTVTDDEGVSASGSLTLRVYSNAPPTINSAAAVPSVVSSNSSGNNAEAVVLSMSATDPEGDALSYYWMIGATRIDGATATLAVDSLAEGTYTAVANVSDASGGSDSETVSFRVNSAPTIAAPVEGQTFSFEVDRVISIVATVTDDSPGPMSYDWSINGASYNDTALQLNGDVLAEGSYPASLTITDSDGSSTTVNFTIEVTTAPAGNLEVIVQ